MSPVLETGDMGVTMPVGCEWFAEGTRFRMLRDRILVRVLDWQPSSWIKVEYSGKPLRGEVVAVGPGAHQKRYYLNEKGERYKVGDTGRTIPCDVRVGDVVELGGLELRGYGFVQVMIGSVLHLSCQEADVAFIDEKPLDENLFGGVGVVKVGAMVQHTQLRERNRGVELKSSKNPKGSHGQRT